jgi:hypothetical protein
MISMQMMFLGAMLESYNIGGVHVAGSVPV